MDMAPVRHGPRKVHGRGPEINKQRIRLRLPVIVHTDARDWFMEVTE